MKRFLSLALLTGIISNHLLFAQENSEPALETPVESSSEKEEFDIQKEEISSSDIVFDLSHVSEPVSAPFLHENDGKKHWFTAIGGMLFFNVGLAAYNRFILGASWAKIGPDEWKYFWLREWEFDNDWYWTNFVLHPYQGGIYYMLARNSNLNYLEASGVTALGSLFWEYLCETNLPSKNDLVYTTFGAFAVGEMLYRLSLNADEMSEIFATFINPARWWTQPLLRQKPLGTTRNIHELSLKTAIGCSNSYTHIINGSGYNYTESENFPFFFSPSLSIVYNDPYGHDSNEPYSQFDLDINLAIGKGSGVGADTTYSTFDKEFMYDIRIMSDGMLFARAPKFSENTDTTLGLTLEYQFDWHQFYEISALGPGGAIKQRVRFENSNLEWQAHLALDIIGTTDYYYYHRPVVNLNGNSTPRNYSMGSGLMTILKTRYIMENGFAANFAFRGYALYDFWDQIPDDSMYPATGWELIGVFEASLELPLSKIARFGLSGEMYMKRTFYNEMPDIFQMFNTLGAFVKFQLK